MHFGARVAFLTVFLPVVVALISDSTLAIDRRSREVAAVVLLGVAFAVVLVVVLAVFVALVVVPVVIAVVVDVVVVAVVELAVATVVVAATGGFVALGIRSIPSPAAFPEPVTMSLAAVRVLVDAHAAVVAAVAAVAVPVPALDVLVGLLGKCKGSAPVLADNAACAPVVAVLVENAFPFPSAST